MTAAERAFQIFAKPVGARCNLNCSYCYYLRHLGLHGATQPPAMSDELLERYVAEQIEATADPVVHFSWHGGEPTLLGLERFRRVVAWQKQYLPPGKEIANGLQTNGLLLDDEWCGFLAEEGFFVGLSIDGPSHQHDRHRLTSGGNGSHERVLGALERLKAHSVATELLCVVHADNMLYPQEVYRYLRALGARYLTFLPLVEREADGAVSTRSVLPLAWGEFLCAVFDEWQASDIGRIKVQIFEEAARVAFGLEHTLCIFRRECGGVPVLEANGDLYACDHFVDSAYKVGNIAETSLNQLIDSDLLARFGAAKAQTLPAQCLRCDVVAMCNGECPRNRFRSTEEGEQGLNYLCEGYLRFFRHCTPFVETIARVWAGTGATDA